MTIEEEIKIRTEERQRAVDLCDSIMEKYNTSYDERNRAEKDLYPFGRIGSIIFVDRERAEIARNLSNAISKKTALSTDTLEERIRKEIEWKIQHKEN